MKVYIAAHLFTQHHIDVINALKESCEMAGAEVFSPYHFSQKIWNGRKPADCSQAERDEVLQANIDNLAWADVLLCWLNRDGDYAGRPDTGVVWEMGYFNALAKADEWEGMRSFPGRITIGYVHPWDPMPASGLNLMLTGTMNALTTSPAEVRAALRLSQWAPAQMSKNYPTNRKEMLEND